MTRHTTGWLVALTWFVCVPALAIDPVLQVGQLGELGSEGLQISPNGRFMAAQASRGITVWDLQTRVELTRIPVADLANGWRSQWLHDYDLLISGKQPDGQAVMRRWSLAENRFTHRTALPGTYGYSLAVSEDGSLTAQTDGYSVLRWRRGDTNRQVVLNHPRGSAPARLRLHPLGRYVAVLTGDTLQVFDTDSAQARLSPKLGEICDACRTALSFDAESDLMAIGQLGGAYTSASVARYLVVDLSSGTPRLDKLLRPDADDPDDPMGGRGLSLSLAPAQFVPSRQEIIVPGPASREVVAISYADGDINGTVREVIPPSPQSTDAYAVSAKDTLIYATPPVYGDVSLTQFMQMRDEQAVAIIDIASGEWIGKLAGGVVEQQILDVDPTDRRVLVKSIPHGVGLWDLDHGRFDWITDHYGSLERLAGDIAYGTDGLQLERLAVNAQGEPATPLQDVACEARGVELAGPGSGRMVHMSIDSLVRCDARTGEINRIAQPFGRGFEEALGEVPEFGSGRRWPGTAIFDSSAITPDSRFVAAFDGTSVLAWDLDHEAALDPIAPLAFGDGWSARTHVAIHAAALATTGDGLVYALSADSAAPSKDLIRQYQASGMSVSPPWRDEVRLYRNGGHIILDTGGLAIDALAFSASGERLAGASDTAIIIWSAVDGSVIQRAERSGGSIETLHWLDEDARLLLSTPQAQELWMLDDAPRRVAILALSDDGYAIVDADGFVKADKAGARLVAYRDGLSAYGFDQFDAILNRPDKVLVSLGSRNADLIKRQARLAERRREFLGVPHEVNAALAQVTELPTISLQTAGGRVSASSASLTVQAKASELRPERLHVSVNGAPIWGLRGKPANPPDDGEYRAEVEIPLAAGRNIIRAELEFPSGLRSRAASAIINAEYDATPTVWLLGVGVSEYADTDNNLRFASKDVRDVERAFRAAYGDRLRSRLLLDEAVTADATRQAAEFLGQSDLNDIAVIYMAGHGLRTSAGYWFATSDTDFANPAEAGWSFDDIRQLQENTLASNKIMFIDTCHAGDLEGVAPQGASDLTGGVTARGGFRRVSTLPDKPADVALDDLKDAFVDLRTRSGSTIIAASGGAEYALESEQWNNGVFTYAVIRGLRDKWADTDRDLSISIDELREFVGEQVLALTGGRQRPTTRQESIIGDFALVRALPGGHWNSRSRIKSVLAAGDGRVGWVTRRNPGNDQPSAYQLDLTTGSATQSPAAPDADSVAAVSYDGARALLIQREPGADWLESRWRLAVVDAGDSVRPLSRGYRKTVPDVLSLSPDGRLALLDNDLNGESQPFTVYLLHVDDAQTTPVELLTAETADRDFPDRISTRTTSLSNDGAIKLLRGHDEVRVADAGGHARLQCSLPASSTPSDDGFTVMRGFAPDGKRVFTLVQQPATTGGAELTLTVASTRTCDGPVVTLSLPPELAGSAYNPAVRHVELSRDGRHALLAGPAIGTRLFDLAEARELAWLRTDETAQVRFTGDSQRVVAAEVRERVDASDISEVSVWEIAAVRAGR